jgi:hypothetical protein
VAEAPIASDERDPRANRPRTCTVCGGLVRVNYVRERYVFREYWHQCDACGRRFTTDNWARSLVGLAGGIGLLVFALIVIVDTTAMPGAVGVKVGFVVSVALLGTLALAQTIVRIRALRANRERR